MSLTYIDADEAIAFARCFCQGMPRGFGALHKPLMLVGQERGRTIPDTAVDEFPPADSYPKWGRFDSGPNRTDNLGVAW